MAALHRPSGKNEEKKASADQRPPPPRPATDKGRPSPPLPPALTHVRRNAAICGCRSFAGGGRPQRNPAAAPAARATCVRSDRSKRTRRRGRRPGSKRDEVLAALVVTGKGRDHISKALPRSSSFVLFIFKMFRCFQNISHLTQGTTGA